MSESAKPLVLDERFVQDAHAVAAELRAASPVRHVFLPGGLPVWLVTGYEQARRAATDPRLSSHRVYDRMERMMLPPGVDSPFSPEVGNSLLNLDPPDHTRIRKSVALSFTSRSVARLRPRIEATADELLDAAVLAQETAEDGAFDLITGYAQPLPVRIIAELLGIPYADREQFVAWSDTLASGPDPFAVGAASAEIADYLGGLIEDKRAAPEDDLISKLASAEDLSRRDIVSTSVVLLMGGFETTANLISSGTLALVRNPAQLDLLRAKPELLAAAVEELLRFDTPNNLSSPRYATADVELGGVTIPAGEFVMISWLGANRAGERFSDADRLDITRRSGGHLAFGHGLHYCVGAPLARLEGEIAFGRLLSRFADVELAAAPESLRWRASMAMHGLEELRVRLR
ncbi:cytochrome P450 family protein [Amycolatopsis sp. A1MSW2902]|uniref:cytochrome P450 family protein n=1 Tax=Amycolatopsis sp. A1MSW2902 TaxID=687413 RepID=UPI00307E86EA